MESIRINQTFSELSTAHIADAMVRLGVDLRVAPHGIQPLVPGTHIAGHVVPVRHFGSVDLFFEAMMMARAGDILVIDNQGRTDEGCIGDLTAIEAGTFGMAGMVLWGCHRDTRELIEMGFPVFSYGRCPFGPLREEQRGGDLFSAVYFGDALIARGDIVFADDDGVVFAPGGEIEKLISTAEEIKATECKQVSAIKRGRSLHEQFQFEAYLARRQADPGYTFRKHLRSIGGAIEE